MFGIDYKLNTIIRSGSRKLEEEGANDQNIDFGFFFKSGGVGVLLKEILNMYV